MPTRMLLFVALCASVATVAAQDAKAPAARQQAPGARPAASSPQGQSGLTVAPEGPARPALPVMMREVFRYDAEGRRDPFVSLLASTELRPTVADLRLVGVLYDETGQRPIAVMRDVTTNEQYRVTTGMTLGRMRVVLIKRRSVIFSVEEFGLNRQDSVMIGDTTKARAK